MYHKRSKLSPRSFTNISVVVNGKPSTQFWISVPIVDQSLGIRIFCRESDAHIPIAVFEKAFTETEDRRLHFQRMTADVESEEVDGVPGAPTLPIVSLTFKVARAGKRTAQVKFTPAESLAIVQTIPFARMLSSHYQTQALAGAMFDRILEEAEPEPGKEAAPAQKDAHRTSPSGSNERSTLGTVTRLHRMTKKGNVGRTPRKTRKATDRRVSDGRAPSEMDVCVANRG